MDGSDRHGLAPPTRLFFGWKVVGAAFFVAAFAWGFGFYGPPVFLAALHRSHGWSIALISAAITTHYLLSAVLVAFLAEIHQRLGLATTTRLGAASLAGGVVCWSLAASPWQLFAASLLTGAGWAMTSGAAIAAIVAPWFERRLGFALGLAFNGASVGGILFTPLWAALIERLGFPGAALLVSFVALALLWPLIGRLLVATPQAMGLGPDGIAATEASRRSPDADECSAAAASRAALLRDRRFLTLTGAFALGLFAQVGLFAHLVALLVPILDAAGAASVVSVVTACVLIGRLVVGTFPARVDWRIVAAANFAMQLCGVLLLLLCLNASGAIPLLLLGCVLFGLGVGNVVSLQPLIAQAEFGRSEVARVVGLTTAFGQAIFSVAPGILGALHDVAAGYALPLAVVIAVQAGATAIVLAGRSRRRLAQ
jgi:MFS family permease